MSKKSEPFETVWTESRSLGQGKLVALEIVYSKNSLQKNCSKHS